MGFLDVFKRGRSSVVIGSRTLSLTVAGFGVEARPRLPVAAAHLADGTVVFGPYDVAGARAQGKIDNVLIRPGTPPAGELARHTMGANSIVTYSTTQRGSTQLVLGVGMSDYAPVLEDVRCADHGARWRILTDDHEVAWPATLVLRADGNLSGRAGYELALDGSADKVIAPHGPYIGDGVPRPENLISPGQRWGDAARSTARRGRCAGTRSATSSAARRGSCATTTSRSTRRRSISSARRPPRTPRRRCSELRTSSRGRWRRGSDRLVDELILLVEDDEDVGEMLTFTLAVNGHAVELARDGRTALEMMRAHRPCLVILDLVLPGMSGWQVLAEMQRSDLADVPVCVVSALIEDEPPSGVVGYLVKPFDTPELLAIATRYCEHRRDVTRGRRPASAGA